MDAGRPEKAIPILREAIEIDPDEPDHQYELAYAYVAMREFTTALGIAEPLLERPDVNPRTYQLVGICYEDMGQTERALQTYRDGLRKFPSFGLLYLEAGVSEARRGRFAEALSWLEQGIAAAPSFPSNYFHAANVSAESGKRVWALLYGETFLVLERDTPRSVQISRLLARLHRSIVTRGEPGPDGKQSIVINVTEPGSQTPEGESPPRVELLYELMLGISLANTALDPDAAAVREARKNAIAAVSDLAKKGDLAPVPLFEWQRRLGESGHDEAYDRWLFRHDPSSDFEQWARDHAAEVEALKAWMDANQAGLTADGGMSRLRISPDE